MNKIRERFFAKIRPAANGCYEWTASKSGGYGRFGLDGKSRLATHVAWFLKYKRWPQSALLHTCDNPACVRPSHLYEGDAKQNAADCVARGRKPRGEKCRYAKLTQSQVDEIRQLHQTRASLAEIAERFNISITYVNAIARRRVWNDGYLPPAKPWSATTYVVDGKPLTIKQIVEQTGLTQATIRARIARGLTGKQLVAAKHRARRKPYTSRS